MATHSILFAVAEGGYNGSNAIVNNTSQFYLDSGKVLSYATLTLSDTSAGENLLDYGTVNGLTVRVEDAYQSVPEGAVPANTFDTAILHTSSDGFTDAITTTPPSADEAANIEIGGSTNTWGKTWSTSDINNMQVRLNNPAEPHGGDSIALLATFVYVIVDYTLSTPQSGTIKVNMTTGKINLSQGQITVS